MRKNIIVAMASLAFLPAVSFAAAPTLSEVLDASGIALTGNVSGSYAYKKLDNNMFFADSASNSFTLDQVHLQIAKLPAEGVGAVIDAYAGQDVAGGTYNYGSPGFYPTGAFNALGAGTNFNVHQAYIQYATGGLTVIGGKFATLAGYEVASDAGNVNATRSMLFSQQAFTLTGVRVGYKFNDMVTAYAGLSNSALGTTVDADDQKTVELALALAPVKGLTVNLTDYIGTDSSSGGNKINFADIVVAYAAGPLSLALNADYNTIKPAVGPKQKVSGVALYANYQLTSAFRAGVRGELGKAKDAFTLPTSDAKVNAVTLTGAYAAAKNLDVVTDVRYSTLKDDSGSGFKQKDTTAVVKAVYKF